MPINYSNTTNIRTDPVKPNALKLNINRIDKNAHHEKIGAMVVNEAPYFEIGYDELYELAPEIRPG